LLPQHLFDFFEVGIQDLQYYVVIQVGYVSWNIAETSKPKLSDELSLETTVCMAAFVS